MQNLWRRSQAARQFNGGFVKQNETTGVIFVINAVFAVNFQAIEKFVAADKNNCTPLEVRLSKYSAT